jgi:hypothetical protein
VIPALRLGDDKCILSPEVFMGAARTTAISTLIFVALSGSVGGVPLMVHAHAEPWWMPQSLLRYSPFRSFLIPGIILFSAIGGLSCWVLFAALQRQPGYGWWVVLQGLVLLGWLIVEVVMLRLAAWPHYFYGAVALVLEVTGIMLVRYPA